MISPSLLALSFCSIRSSSPLASPHSLCGLLWSAWLFSLLCGGLQWAAKSDDMSLRGLLYGKVSDFLTSSLRAKFSEKEKS